MGPGALSVLLASSSSSFLRLLLRPLLSVLVLSCPGEVKRDPSYPPLVDSPSLPTPCEDREDGYTTKRGAVGIPFLPFGFGDCQTLLLQGSCFVWFWFCLIGCSSPDCCVLLFVGSCVLSYVFCICSCFFCCKTPGFAGRSKGCAGSPSLSMVCLCFCCCFVCLLVGRLVLSFSGVRCLCSCCFCFARVASFESFVCCGGAWGVFLFLSAGVKRVSACSSRKAPQLHLVISLLAVPSVLSLPRSFVVLCMHACAMPARACAPCVCGPLNLLRTCLSPLSFCLQELFCLKLFQAACCYPPSSLRLPVPSLLYLPKMADANVDAPVQQRNVESSAIIVSTTRAGTPVRGLRI